MPIRSAGRTGFAAALDAAAGDAGAKAELVTGKPGLSSQAQRRAAQSGRYLVWRRMVSMETHGLSTSG